MKYSPKQKYGTGGTRANHKITESMQIIIPNIQKHLTSRKVHRTQLQSIAFHTCRKYDI